MLPTGWLCFLWTLKENVVLNLYSHQAPLAEEMSGLP